jgi:hypothetical protein
MRKVRLRIGRLRAVSGWAELAAPTNASGLWLSTRSSVAKLTSEMLTAPRYGQMVFEIPELTQPAYDRL